MLGLLNENPTVRRMRHVQKVYGHVPGVVGATMAIVTGGRLDGRFYGRREWADEDFGQHIHQLRTMGPVDPYIPWVAREVRKALKAHDRHDHAPPGLDVRAWTTQWEQFVRDWLVGTRPDIARLRFTEAVERGHQWHEQMKADRKQGMQAEPGTIVAELSDGWTAQLLESPSQLEDEGDVMGHCVGSYWSRVQAGLIAILSLRDRKGSPHVTIELAPPGGTGRIYSPLHQGRYDVEQIQGKENSLPVERYHRYIIEALEPLLTNTSKESWEYRIFLPNGREAYWEEATGDEDVLQAYITDFEDDEPGLEQLRDVIDERVNWLHFPPRLSTATALKSQGYGLSVSLDGEAVSGEGGARGGTLDIAAELDEGTLIEVEQRAQDSYLESVYGYSQLSDHPAFDDELVSDAWQAGAERAWKEFHDAIEQECSVYENATAHWRFAMIPRQEFLAKFIEEPGDKPWTTYASKAHSWVFEASKNIQSSFESWAQHMTEYPLDKLRELLDEAEG